MRRSHRRRAHAARASRQALKSTSATNTQPTDNLLGARTICRRAHEPADAPARCSPATAGRPTRFARVREQGECGGALGGHCATVGSGAHYHIRSMYGGQSAAPVADWPMRNARSPNRASMDSPGDRICGMKSANTRNAAVAATARRRTAATDPPDSGRRRLRRSVIGRQHVGRDVENAHGSGGDIGEGGP